MKSPTKPRENAKQSGREAVKSPTKLRENANQSGIEVVKSPTKLRENANQSGIEAVKNPTKPRENANQSGMKEEKAMRTRKEVLEYGLSFPNTYQDAPFRDTNWQLIRCKKNKNAFLWIYERDGNLCINIKVNAEWRDLWRATYPSVLPGQSIMDALSRHLIYL